MRRCVTGTIASLVCLGLVAIPGLALDEVVYRAAVDKTKIKLGEPVQYLVTVQYGKGTMTPAIAPPSFMQFTVLDEFEKTETQHDGVEAFSVLKKIWLLEPTEAGRLSVASAIVTYQDPTTLLLRNGKTDIVFLEVEPSAQTPPEAPGPPRSPLAKPELPGMFWIAGVTAALVALSLFVLLRRRPRGDSSVASGRSLEDQALAALQAAVEYVENEQLAHYYAEMTRIFFEYLQNKFGLDAQALSTPELLNQLAPLGLGASDTAALREFLTLADKVKFAGHVPGEEEMIRLHAMLNHFFETSRTRRDPRQPKRGAKRPRST